MFCKLSELLCGILGDENIESKEDYGCLDCEILAASKDSNWPFVKSICDVWPGGPEESAVINQRPETLK